MAVIVSHGIIPLAASLSSSSSEHLQVELVWILKIIYPWYSCFLLLLILHAIFRRVGSYKHFTLVGTISLSHKCTGLFIISQAASAWALGQVGNYSPSHAQYVIDAGVLPVLLRLASIPSASEELQTKVSRSVKNILQKCSDLLVLESILTLSPLPPAHLLNFGIVQIAKILTNDVRSRKNFAANGGLRRLQELAMSEGGELEASVTAVNALFPEELVRFNSPKGVDALLWQLDMNEATSIPT